MINLNAYPKIKSAQEGMSSPMMTDLVAIGNCRRSGDIVSTVISDNDTYIDIDGLWGSNTYTNRYCLAGRELMKITSTHNLTSTTRVYVERAKYGTINSYENRLLDNCAIEPNFYFRTVDLFDNISACEISGNGGNMSELFSFQCETGKVVFEVENFEDFNVANSNSKYLLRAKKSTIHLFKGFNGERFLSYTGFFNTSNESYGRGERNLTVNFYDKFGVIYNTKISDSFVFENVKPKEMIATMLKIPNSMVYYSNGLTEANFKYIKSVYSKEYTYYKEFFQALVGHGIRLTYDELERVKVFSDLEALAVIPDTEVPIYETNILDSKRSSDSKYIRNRFTSTYYARQPMYDFVNTFNSKHVYFRYNIPVTGYTLCVGNDEYAELVVESTHLMSKTEIGDLVLLVHTPTNTQIYGRILDKTSATTSHILVGQYSKDSWLTSYGKYSYLTGLGFNTAQNFTLYYSSERLPEVMNITIDYSSGEKSSKLKFPLLPQVVGEDEKVKSWDMAFGSVEDLETYTYAGITTNVDGIYGTWDNSKLLYDKELDQFNGTNPPVYVISNKLTAPQTLNGVLTFGTFDNSNLQVTIEKSTDSEYDVYTTFKNTISINSNLVTSLFPVARTLGTTLQVSSLDGINIGDVLVVQKHDNMTTIDLDTYNKVKGIRYIIMGKITEGSNYYITLSDTYPIAEGSAFVFSAKKYPYDSIVFLQEFFIRGNPVLQEEVAIDISNAESIDTYDEIGYSFEGNFYDEDSYKDLIDYLYNGFGAVGTDDRKFVHTIKVRDSWQFSRGDVIRFRDSIYTGVETTSLWYVLSSSYKLSSPEATISVINLNTFNADGSWVDFDSQLTYQSSSEVLYTYNESETGNTVINETDNIFGTISATKISRDVFRADISTVVDSLITFTNFNGTDVTNKQALLFDATSNTIFIALVGNEYLYLKSQSDTTAIILKRNLFNSPTSELDSNQTVTFYYISSTVTTDGTLISQDLYVGNSTNYIQFDSDTGKTNIRSVGEIEIANTNNRFYFDPATTNNKSQILIDVGDWSTGFEDVEFQIGLPTTGKGYFKYDDDTGLSMSGKIFLEDGTSGSGNINFGNRFYMSTYDFGGQNLFALNDLYWGGGISYLSSQDSTGRIGNIDFDFAGTNGITHRFIMRGGQSKATPTFDYGESCYCDTRLNLSIPEDHWVTVSYTGIGLYQNTSRDKTDFYHSHNKIIAKFGNNYTLYSNVSGITIDGLFSENFTDKDTNGSLRYVSEQTGVTSVTIGDTNYTNVPVIRERLLFKTRMYGWVTVGEWTFTPDSSNTSKILTDDIVL